jgi:hypothetical protein
LLELRDHGQPHLRAGSTPLMAPRVQFKAGSQYPAGESLLVIAGCFGTLLYVPYLAVRYVWRWARAHLS